MQNAVLELKQGLSTISRLADFKIILRAGYFSIYQYHPDEKRELRGNALLVSRGPFLIRWGFMQWPETIPDWSVGNYLKRTGF
jgi:hypothetical protein